MIVSVEPPRFRLFFLRPAHGMESMDPTKALLLAFLVIKFRHRTFAACVSCILSSHHVCID
jgi:hypothetical protein